MRLSEIQIRFKDMMLGDTSPDDDFSEIFAVNDIALPDRMNIYRNNVMGNVGNALMQNFPLLEKLVGREFLTAMARRYILAHPPTTGHLTFYGSDFDEFIKSYEPARNLPYLPDMAKLEILANLAENARDDFPLTASDLSEIPEDRLRMFHVKPRDSAHFMTSAWPLLNIRELCLKHGEKVDMHSGGVFLMVHRPLLKTEITEISESEYAFLSRLHQQPLGIAVADTLQLYPDFDFPTVLGRHINLQTFSKPENQ